MKQTPPTETGWNLLAIAIVCTILLVCCCVATFFLYFITLTMACDPLAISIILLLFIGTGTIIGALIVLLTRFQTAGCALFVAPFILLFLLPFKTWTPMICEILGTLMQANL